MRRTNCCDRSTSYDQGMETKIYVVSSCWWRDGATVIGAAMDRPGAEAIADRYENDPYGYDDAERRVTAWSPWQAESRTDEPRSWRRDALLSDGTVHTSLYQEIVCVPLATPVDKSVTAINTPLNLATLFPPMPPPEEARNVVEMTIKAITSNRALGFRPQPEDIRVGVGPAKDFVQREADRLLSAIGNPPSRPWEVNGGLMAGLRIVVDPNIPPNMIRVGGVAYLIDVPTEGSMVRIGDEVLNWLTSPPD